MNTSLPLSLPVRNKYRIVFNVCNSFTAHYSLNMIVRCVLYVFYTTLNDTGDKVLAFKSSKRGFSNI